MSSLNNKGLILNHFQYIPENFYRSKYSHQSTAIMNCPFNTFGSECKLNRVKPTSGLKRRSSCHTSDEYELPPRKQFLIKKLPASSTESNNWRADIPFEVACRKSAEETETNQVVGSPQVDDDSLMETEEISLVKCDSENSHKQLSQVEIPQSYSNSEIEAIHDISFIFSNELKASLKQKTIEPLLPETIFKEMKRTSSTALVLWEPAKPLEYHAQPSSGEHSEEYQIPCATHRFTDNENTTDEEVLDGDEIF